MRNPGRDISFPIFIRKEIETMKLERKSKQKNISFNRLIISFNKSLKRYKIEWKLKQEKQKGNKIKKNRKEMETTNMSFKRLLIFPFQNRKKTYSVVCST